MAFALLSGKKLLSYALLVGGFPLTAIMPGVSFFAFFGGINPQAALLFALMISAILLLLLHIDLTARYLIRFYFCTGFALFIIASLVWSNDLIQGVRFVVKLVAPILFMFTAMVVCKTDKDVVTMERLAIICGVIVLSFAVVNTLTGGIVNDHSRVDWIAKKMLTAPYMTPANFSFLMGVLAMVSIGNYLSGRGRGWLILYLVFSGAVLWAFTRISLAGWLIGTGICVVFLVRSRVIKFAIPVTIGLAFVASVLTVDSIRERMFFAGSNVDISTAISDPGELLSKVNTSGRAALWKKVDEALGKHGVMIGNGIGSVDSWLERNDYSRMHSEYLRLYYDVGIVGLVLYILILLSLIQNMRKLSRSDDADTRKLAAIAAASLTYYLITMATDNTLNYVTEFGLYVFSFTGLAFNASLRSKQSRPRQLHEYKTVLPKGPEPRLPGNTRSNRSSFFKRSTI